MGLIIYYGLKEEQIIPNDSNYTIGFFGTSCQGNIQCYCIIGF